MWCLDIPPKPRASRHNSLRPLSGRQRAAEPNILATAIGEEGDHLKRCARIMVPDLIAGYSLQGREAALRCAAKKMVLARDGGDA